MGGLSLTSRVKPATLAAAVQTAVQAIDVDAQVAQAMEDYAPGTWLGGAERLSAYSAGNSDISAFTASVVGKGRPVRVEAYLPMVYNSTNAGVGIRLDLKQDGATIQRGFGFSPSLTGGGSVRISKKTAVLTLGQTYVFTVGIFNLGAGTMNIYAAAVGPTPMTIDVYAA